MADQKSSKLIEEYLPYGSDHPVTAAALARMLHTSEREVFKMIREAGDFRGVPIGSIKSAEDRDHAGLFIIQTKEEAAIYCERNRQETRELERRRKPVEEWLDSITE